MADDVQASGRRAARRGGQRSREEAKTAPERHRLALQARRGRRRAASPKAAGRSRLDRRSGARGVGRSKRAPARSRARPRSSRPAPGKPSPRCNNKPNHSSRRSSRRRRSPDLAEQLRRGKAADGSAEQIGLVGGRAIRDDPRALELGDGDHGGRGANRPRGPHASGRDASNVGRAGADREDREARGHQRA